MGSRSREVNERRERRERRRRRADAGQVRGCLFCRASDGGFTSQEHIFPESLGNKTIVLPNGVVCDRCNHERLSVLDQTICDFAPVKMRRTMLGVESKNGRVPITRFASGSLHNDGGDALRLMMNRANDSRTVRETNLGDGRVQLDWSMTGGRRLTERYASDLSRALLKSALECGWLDHGKRILDPSLDHVRQAVLGARRDGYIVIAAKADPDDISVTLTYDFTIDDDGNRGIVVGASYFGVVLVTDSRAAQPRSPLPDDVATVLAFQGQPA